MASGAAAGVGRGGGSASAAASTGSGGDGERLGAWWDKAATSVSLYVKKEYFKFNAAHFIAHEVRQCLVHCFLCVCVCVCSR